MLISKLRTFFSFTRLTEEYSKIIENTLRQSQSPQVLNAIETLDVDESTF